MTQRARTDVLLAEASLAHLAAAAVLARSGLRVSLLQGAGASEAPPWTHPPLGLLPPAGAGSLLEELFVTCDLPPPIRRAFRTPPVLFQVIWPGMRIDVASDRQRYRRGLDRELGEAEADRIERFENEIDEGARSLLRALQGQALYPPGGLLSRFRPGRLPKSLERPWARQLRQPLSDAFARAGLGEEARRYLGLRLRVLTPMLDDDPPLGAAALALSAGFREHALLPPAETPELRDLLAAQVLKRGAQLVSGRIREVRRGAEGTWQVETSAGEMLRARAVVEGEALLQERACAKGASFLATRTLRLVIDPQAVPVGMCPRGIMMDDPGADPRDGNLIFYCIEPPGQEGGPARLWATILAGSWPGRGEAGATAEEGPPPPPEPVRRRVLLHLGRVLPFLDQFLGKSAWLPPAGRATCGQGLTQGEAGIAGPGYRARGRGRLALGRSNLPTLGAWGEIKAAFAASALLEGLLKEK